jgi:hypothetical protein
LFAKKESFPAINWHMMVAYWEVANYFANTAATTHWFYNSSTLEGLLSDGVVLLKE